MFFISEENMLLHKDYMRNLRLKYSILEKSVQGLSGMSIKDIYKSGFSSDIKAEALDLLYEIKLHELFFSSFCNVRNPSSKYIREEYGSESAFMNQIYKRAMALPYGFCAVGVLRNKIVICENDGIKALFMLGEPVIALDICEHAYYGDYGFDRGRYLREAIPMLNMSIFDEILGKG